MHEYSIQDCALIGGLGGEALAGAGSLSGFILISRGRVGCARRKARFTRRITEDRTFSQLY